MTNYNNNDKEDQIFETLLGYLRQARGFDFTGYKRSSLKRRVTKQMESRQIENFNDYLDYLQVHPEEFSPLFNTILINVTSFFRDQNAWECLQNEIIPLLLASKSENEQIRVWSAGCASGEEAYTIAMILAEILGIKNFRERVKIYATDIDEESLTEARRAIYSAKDLELVPQELKQKYFELVGEQYIFHPDLRRVVIFGRHDLVQDAPISRLDILICRNTLMYFNAETQGRILHRFHFALKNTGFLFLGKAEMLLTHTNLFIPVHLQHRIFNRVSRIAERERILALSGTNNNDDSNNRLNRHLRLQQLSFEIIPLANLVVDFRGNLILANMQAREMFGINLNDFGRPLQDLEISYRPIELRSHIEQVYQEHLPIKITDVMRNLPNDIIQYLEILINPLQENDNLLGVSIAIFDVTYYQELKAELQKSNQELETVTEEMQSSNEELETTNEELQSTNEELETTNEELQSTNEELETMNEELQSTNQELQTINDELHQRTQELNQANAFLNSILTSLKAGVIVIDCQFKILSWNNEAENLWGLRTNEVKGQSFFGLDIGLSLEQLRNSIRNCLADNNNHPEMIVSAINRRGQSIQCRVSFNPLLDSQQQRLGVILVMDEI